MTVTSRALSSHSKRSSASEHTFPQVCKSAPIQPVQWCHVPPLGLLPHSAPNGLLQSQAMKQLCSTLSKSLSLLGWLQSSDKLAACCRITKACHTWGFLLLLALYVCIFTLTRLSHSCPCSPSPPPPTCPCAPLLCLALVLSPPGIYYHICCAGCSQMIADVEPLSGMRRYPSLSLGASWERHTLSLQQSNGLSKQGTGQQDMMTFADEGLSSPGLLFLSSLCSFSC